MSECETFDDALDAACDNLDILAPRDVAAFWATAPRLLPPSSKRRFEGGKGRKGSGKENARGRGKCQGVRGRRKQRQHSARTRGRFEAILGRTLDDLEKFGFRELATTALGLAKIACKVAVDDAEGASEASCSRDLFEKIAARIVSFDQARLNEFDARHLANVSWAYSKAKEYRPELFERLASAAVERRDGFTPQGAANLLWAFAASGHLDHRLFASFMPALKAMLGEFNAQDVANVAWAYAAANVDAPDLFDEEFSSACEERGNLFARENLRQLHQWQLWQAEFGSEIQLSQSLRERCREAFVERAPEPSAMQRDVVAELSRISGANVREEELTESGYIIDALVEMHGRRIAFEVDGPSHFVRRRPTGSTILKRRQVACLEGVEVVSVPYWAWDELGNDVIGKQRYLRSLIGLDSIARGQ